MKTKKVLSVILSIAMIVLMAVPAFATAGSYDRAKVASNDAATIEALSAEQVASVILDWVDRQIEAVSADFEQFNEQLALVGMSVPENLDGIIGYKSYLAQLEGDFANLDTSALKTRTEAGSDLDFVYSVISFMAANSDIFGKVFYWNYNEEGKPEQAEGNFDFGKVGEFITNPENGVDETIVNFYNDYLIGNDIQSKFVKEIAREMNYEIKDGETFDEVIDNGIKSVVVGLLKDTGLLSEEAANKVYDDAQFDLKTEDVYTLVKKLIALVQEDNWADLTMYYTYLLDNVARPLLKTAFGYTATTGKAVAVPADFTATYTDLEALEEISGGKVQYKAADGSYVEVTISNGVATAANEVTYSESFINFEAPEVTIADKGSFSATYTPTTPDTTAYNPTVYTDASYADYLDDVKAAAGEFGVNVSTDALPEAIANIIAAGNGVAMKDAFVMTVGAPIDQSLEISFDEIEAMANETIASQLPSIQENMVNPAVETAVNTANTMKANMGALGSFLPDFTGSVTINSVTVKLDYTGYKTDDTFVCQVSVTPTYDITYGGNVWDYAQYAGITKEKIQSDYIAPAVEAAIKNPVATIAVENLSGSIEGFEDVEKLMSYVDTDFVVDTSILDFSADYDAYNGAIGQMNKVLVGATDMVLTDEGEAWLGLTEGGNEYLTANLQKICDKANGLVNTVEEVMNNNQYSDFLKEMGVDLDLDAIVDGLGLDFLYNIDFSSPEGLYVTVIKTAAEVAPQLVDDAEILEIVNLVKGYDSLEQMAVAVFNYAMPKCAAKANELLSEYGVTVAFEATTDAAAIANEAAAKEYIMSKGVALLYDVAEQAVPAANKVINDAIKQACDYLGVDNAPVVDFKLGVKEGATWEETLTNLVDRFYALTDGVLSCLDKSADVYGKISAVANGFFPLSSMLSNAGKNGANGSLDVAYVMDVLFNKCLAGDFSGFLKMFEVKEDAIAGNVSVTKALIKASQHMVDPVFPGTVVADNYMGYTPATEVQEYFTSREDDVVIASNNMKSIDSVKTTLIPALLTGLVKESGVLPFFAACNNHDFGDAVVVESTCTVAGTSTVTCKSCGYKVVETLPLAEHKVVVIPAVEATCTTAGNTAGEKCSVCGTIITATTVVPAKGHSYGAWSTTVQPTCTSEGKQVRTCSVCLAQETKAVPAKGHSFGAWTVTKAPTCSEEGSQTSTCSACGTTKTESIQKTNHTDEDKDNECDICGETISNSFGAKIKAFFQKIINWFKNLFK